MIYTLIGTNITLREKAQDELSKLGTVTTHIYSEQIENLEPLISASSLFGEKVVVNIMQVMEVASSREELVKLLPHMKNSVNVFIIDELFPDAHDVSKLNKYTEKLFDAREEKKKVDIFTFCNFFAKRDKKEAWGEWMRIRDLAEPEAICGLLWWKFQTIWFDVQDGKSSKFTKEECEKFGERIALASMRAHNGELDLKVELETLVLFL